MPANTPTPATAPVTAAATALIAAPGSGRAPFLDQLMESAAGRQHMLSIAVEAEEGDEGDIFGQLVGLVDDPKLRRIVERHRDDEARHAQLFRGCLDRLGLTQQPVPDDLRIIRQIADASGGFDQGVLTTDDVVGVYAMLAAIEERGVEQFPLIAEAFRPHDAETAEVYLQVARDERGHTRYCEQIGRRYAADDGQWEAMLTLTRAVEAAAFAAVSDANVAYCAEQGWVDGGVSAA